MKHIQKTVCTLLIFISITLNSFSQNSVAIVSPNAVYIDGDFRHFQEGFCVVESKDNGEGLINTKGEVVVPYGKYKFSFMYDTDRTVGFYNGYCRVQNPTTKLYGFLDKNLKEILLQADIIIAAIGIPGFIKGFC